MQCSVMTLQSFCVSLVVFNNYLSGVCTTKYQFIHPLLTIIINPTCSIMKYLILKMTKDAPFKAYDPVPELWGGLFHAVCNAKTALTT